MKSFIEIFIEQNADTLYCSVCLEPTETCCQGCNNQHIAFKEFDAATQLEIMKEELRNAYNS
jgi:hypothetical protein